MTTSVQAKKVVLVSTAVTVTLTSVGTIRRDGKAPGVRVAIGALVAGVGLAAVAEFAPPIASGLAALMLVTSVFVLGGDAMTGISAIVKPTPVTD